MLHWGASSGFRLLGEIPAGAIMVCYGIFWSGQLQYITYSGLSRNMIKKKTQRNDHETTTENEANLPK